MLFLYSTLIGFLNRLKIHRVGAYATQAAFFIVLSIFPFISLLLSLIKYTPITKEFMLSTMNTLMPDIVQPMLNTLTDELYASTNGAALSITILFTLWSAAKGILAIIYGLDSIYDIEDKRNYFVLRFIASIYTVLLLVALITSLGLLVFGNSIYEMTKKPFPVVYETIGIFLDRKQILSFLILILFFLFIYKLVPQKQYSMISLMPGACIASFGWLTFSYAFSLYIKFSDTMSYTYGSLTTIVISLMWIYICMYILFIGAEINIYFRDYFRKLHQKFKKKHS